LWLHSLLSPIAKWCRGYADLFFVRWANVRNEWYFYVIVGPLFPLALMMFLKLTGAATDAASGLYVSSGNAVMGMVLGPMQSLCNDLAWARQRNDLEYFASLPVSKLQFTLAFTSVSSIFTIPAVLLTVYAGKWWFGFPVRWNPLVVPVMVVSALSMAGLGVLGGVHARNGHHANIMNNLAMLVVMFLSPVLIPYENLPPVLRLTSKVLPTTYAADAFRAVLAGNTGQAALRPLCILAGFAVVSLYLATQKLDWRTE